MIHHRLPYPLTSGMDKVRYNLIRSLALEHKVTLIAPADEFTKQEDIDHIRNICHELIAVPVKDRVNAIRNSIFLRLFRLLRQTLFRVPMYVSNNEHPAVAQEVQMHCAKDRYDLVQVTSNFSSCYLRFASSVRPHVLGPMDDMIESAWSDMLVARTFRARFYFFMEYYARKHYEIKAALNADWVFFHSKDDLQRVSDLAGGLPQALILRVAVESEDEPRLSLQTPLKVQEPNSLIFVGGLGSSFNIDAVLFFYKQIFPLILKKVPEAKLYIVGQNPPPEIKSLEQSGQVVVTGSVPDVRPYIEKAAVYIAPVRSGTGFKTKVVEALSLGKAIVSTSRSLQGLWDLGEDVVRIRDNPGDFANEIVRLLQNEDLRVELGMRARRLYERSYSFDAVSPRTLEVYKEIENSIFSKCN